MERRVIIIAGPTASGKSDIAFTLAKTLSTEIISADSRQIYRKLDIGAAKPPDEYLTAVRHHFINSHDLNQPFDAGAFEVEALKIIDEMHSKGLIPIVCGGSGLYIRALIKSRCRPGSPMNGKSPRSAFSRGSTQPLPSILLSI